MIRNSMLLITVSFSLCVKRHKGELKSVFVCIADPEEKECEKLTLGF